MAEPLFVAAFDIGTTYSGWAYSSVSDFKKDPTQISMKQPAGGLQTRQLKEPTSLYIQDNGRVLFGYAAENAYDNNCTDRDDFMYFSTFKMTLNTWDVNANTTVKATNDPAKELDVVKLFSHILSCLVTDLRQTISQRVINFAFPDNLFFIVTVPAIWTDAAKQIMRKAAINAGMPTDKLVLALEPECCSVCCLHIHSLKTDENELSHLRVGTKYIVIDAGGGTIDVAVHKICEDGKIEEVYYATGGGWGGKMVDEEFENMISRIVGADVFANYLKNEISDTFHLRKNWEEKKRLFAASREQCLIKISMSLIELFKKAQSGQYQDGLKIKRDKLELSKDCMGEIFAPAVTKTVDHIKQLMCSDAVRDISVIFMAGGFSECSILTSAIKDEFPHLNVVVPDDASLCTLKGAVMYGHSVLKHENTDESSGLVISKRVLKYTYGVEVLTPFKHGKHPISKLITTDSGDRCECIFRKIIEKAETIAVNDVLTVRLYTTYKCQKAVLFRLFASEKNDHEFTDEDGCREIGRLEIILPNPTVDNGRGVSLMFKFGGTELTVTARDRLSGHQAQCSLDFNVIDETMGKA